MRLIYMASTLGFIAHVEGTEKAQSILQSGELKQTEAEVKYIIIKEE